ncbi:lytic transglycosylase domain-containing protein [Sporosarcina sp. 179-K 3D1 HS]|uniref:lytic transglycosylase domain-containing protein n=1 Tax=Sporosarcina sp. 179-K 3D1 HS TaxID=3232169 RepID=UPI00399F660D
MDVRSLRTLMEINSLQSLGSVQTYAGLADSSPALFQMMLEDMIHTTSMAESLSSVSATALETAAASEPLHYGGMNHVFIPDSLLSVQAINIPNAVPATSQTKVSGGLYADIIKQAAEKYNIPEKLIASVIRQESNFNNEVVSRSGAQGLMQLMPGTARFLGVTNSFDPVQNIMGGSKYLRQMLDKFGGNVELALAAYNAGPGNVKKHGGIPPFKETQQYVRKVLGYYNGVSV